MHFKRITMSAALFLTLAMTFTAGGRERAMRPQKGRLVLIRDLTVESVIFDAALSYVVENLSLDIKADTVKGTSLAMLTVSNQLSVVEGKVGNDKAPALAVALVREPADVKERVLLLRERRAGIVNLSVLQPEIRGTDDEQEQFRRLVQKETLRTVGYLLGLKQCFNPRCCMSGYRLQQGQNLIARNYCPACRIKIEEELSQ
jgi:hypothetical protein